MQYAFMSDNHDHYQSLDFVPTGLNGYYHIGDICESHAEDARKCIQKLQELDAKCVLGRHDRAIFDEKARNYFRQQAESGICVDENWQNYRNAVHMERNLGSEYIEWLKRWSDPVMRVPLPGDYNIVLVHDSLERLTKDESISLDLGGRYKSRVVTPELARRNFKNHFFNLLVVGHIHNPLFWEGGREGADPQMGIFWEERNDLLMERWEKRYIVCPGSMCGDSGFSQAPHVPFRLDKKRSSFGILSYDTEKDTALFTIKFLSEEPDGS
jgi:predicted phosphodiesterase